MSDYKAVLFDLDGTLTNTLDDIADAMNRSLRLHGLPEFPVADYRYLVGRGARNLALQAVREHTELHEAVLRDYQAYYERHTLVKTCPYDGIPALLSALAARGMKLCVFSNKPDADTRGIVRHFFPEVPFFAVRGQVEGVPVKPDPAGALALAGACGVAPESFLYLGDTSVDMTCARNAGMTPVGVLWGFRDEKELRESGAAHIIARPEALLDLLD